MSVVAGQPRITANPDKASVILYYGKHHSDAVFLVIVFTSKQALKAHVVQQLLDICLSRGLRGAIG